MFARALAVALLLTLATAGRVQAAAQNLFIKLDRVEVEPYFGLLARVRLYVDPMTVEGGLISGIKNQDFVLELNGVQRRERPGVLSFAQTEAPVDLIVVLQISFSFTTVLEDIIPPLGKLMKGLPRGSRVSLITFGGGEPISQAIKVKKSFSDPGSVARALDAVAAEDDAEPPELVKAMDRAIKQFKQAPPSQNALKARRIILTISDGSNVGDDWDDAENMKRFNALARAASTDGITVSSVAFSQGDRRDPYRNLAQLARRTAGTFRWARDRSAIGNEIEQDLLKEIRDQTVLTYFVPIDQVVEAKVRVICKSGACGESPLPSNDRKGPAPTCGLGTCSLGEVCVASSQCMPVSLSSGGSNLGRNLAIGAIALVGLGGVTVLLRRRKANDEKPIPGRPAPAGAPPPQAVPIQVPDFSNMPYLSGSAGAQQLAAQLGQVNRGQPPPPQAVAPVRAGTLLIMNGARQGQMLPLRHGFTIGKTLGCDLQIDDGYTSGYHTQFQLDQAGGCTVVDMNSTNGTFVNGVRTSRQTLTHGMVVRAGGIEVRYLQG